MSGFLLTAAIDHVRTAFTRAEVATVQPYGGEFSGAEVKAASFSCPAIFVTVLGWKPEEHGTRLTGKHVRDVRMAAFVVTKAARREQRMVAAMNLAEKLALAMRLWRPDSSALPITIAPLEEDASCENLYGRLIDEQGLALWLVDWQQCVKPDVPLEQLYDLVAVEIVDHVHQGTTPAPATGPATPLVVTEEINFVPILPA